MPDGRAAARPLAQPVLACKDNLPLPSRYSGDPRRPQARQRHSNPTNLLAAPSGIRKLP